MSAHAETTPTSARELARILLASDSRPSCRELDDLHRRLTLEYSHLAAEAQRGKSQVQEALTLGSDEHIAAARSAARAAEEARYEAAVQVQQLATRIDETRVAEREARLDAADKDADDALAQGDALLVEMEDLTTRHVAALLAWTDCEQRIREADKVLRAGGRAARSGLESSLRPGNRQGLASTTVLPAIRPGGLAWTATQRGAPDRDGAGRKRGNATTTEH